MTPADYDRLELARDSYRYVLRGEDVAARAHKEATARRVELGDELDAVCKELGLVVPCMAALAVADFILAHYRAGRVAQAHLTPPPPIVLSSDASLSHSTQPTPLEAPTHDN